MSNNPIDSARIAQNKVPWSDDASREVQGLRRALTANPKEMELEHDVAPMMSDLLARLDELVQGPDDRVLAKPSMDDPWSISPERAMRDATRACASLKEFAAKKMGTPESTRILDMVAIVEEHLALKREIIGRAGQSS